MGGAGISGCLAQGGDQEEAYFDLVHRRRDLGVVFHFFQVSDAAAWLKVVQGGGWKVEKPVKVQKGGRIGRGVRKEREEQGGCKEKDVSAHIRCNAEA